MTKAPNVTSQPCQALAPAALGRVSPPHPPNTHTQVFLPPKAWDSASKGPAGQAAAPLSGGHQASVSRAPAGGVTPKGPCAPGLFATGLLGLGDRFLFNAGPAHRPRRGHAAIAASCVTTSGPRSPGAGDTPNLRLPVPTQNALTKLPRARAAPPHIPAPHSVTQGLRSQHPRPAGHRLSRIPSCSSYTATSGLTPAPHKARPRDPASAPHSRSAPARTPARWVPTPRAAPAQVLVPAPGAPLTSAPAVTPGPGVRRCDFAARRLARPWVSGTTAAQAGRRVGRGAPSSDLDKAASYPGLRRRHHRLALQAACPRPGASGGGTGAPGARGARSGP